MDIFVIIAEYEDPSESTRSYYRYYNSYIGYFNSKEEAENYVNSQPKVNYYRRFTIQKVKYLGGDSNE